MLQVPIRTATMTTILKWLCACGFRNEDEIDPDYGPFITCTCGGCGKSFDQDRVQKVA